MYNLVGEHIGSTRLAVSFGDTQVKQARPKHGQLQIFICQSQHFCISCQIIKTILTITTILSSELGTAASDVSA